MYRIGELICETMKRKNISKSELVKRIGYENTGKGVRKLDELVQNGIAHEFILFNLAKALDIPETEIKEAIILTYEEQKKEIEDYERSVFKPHLVIQTKSQMPSSITFCVFTGGFSVHRTIRLPEDFPGQEHEKQLDIIKNIIKEHYTRKNGESHFFGKILGYILCKDFDEAPENRLTFDANGAVSNDVPKGFVKPEREKEGIFVKGRRLPFYIPFENI